VSARDLSRRAAAAVALAALLAAATDARAAATAITWLPSDGATGYRIERATKPTGPWRIARDVSAQPLELRPSGLQLFSIDGLTSRGQTCIRVRAVQENPEGGKVFSVPSEVVCFTLPRASVDFGKLIEADPPVQPPPPNPAPVLWSYCAGEGERCAFTGTRRVRYGNAPDFNELTLTNGADCSNGVFGDPVRGRWKYCEVAQ
jgi:hypothetical protein